MHREQASRILAFPRHAAPPVSMRARATDDLSFIRSTMERAASFTCIPGWGGACMGAVALVATPIAMRATSPTSWLAAWLAAAAVAGTIGALDIVHKARVERASLLRGPGSRFAMSLLPGLFVGACLTVVLARMGRFELLPGVWLLLYGVAILAAGAFSIRAVRLMGAAFLALGTLAVCGPESAGDLLMAAGFGGLHVVFGIWIARNAHA